jgi:SHS2 domain-containing protein
LVNCAVVTAPNFGNARCVPLFCRLLGRGNIGAMYETFEHTADLGLRVRAATLDELFAEAGRALFSVIVDDLDAVKPLRAVKVELAGDEREYLLFDWLKELLYFFDAEHLLLSRFEVKVAEDRLTGTAWGEPLDRDRHTLAHEVKAITYHGLKVEQRVGEWLAEVIVDI